MFDTVVVSIGLRDFWLMTDRLDAYYILIHPAFPILPSAPKRLPDDRKAHPIQENITVGQESPLSHAIAVLVALIPKSVVNGCSLIQARVARHDYAEHCCGLALANIDRDLDAPEPLTRSRFHRDVPVQLESTIASFLVAVYEYSYRGTMMKARTRMASVITMAMDLGLHNINQGIISDFECKQRLWSMIASALRHSSIRKH